MLEAAWNRGKLAKLPVKALGEKLSRASPIAKACHLFPIKTYRHLRLLVRFQRNDQTTC